MRVRTVVRLVSVLSVLLSSSYASWNANAQVPLPFTGRVSSNETAFSISNTGSGDAINGFSGSRNGVFGQSETGSGLHGYSRNQIGVYGRSDSGDAIVGETKQSGKNGVLGTNPTEGGNGVAGISEKGNGLYGASKSQNGVYGQSETGSGVHGYSKDQIGLFGKSDNGTGLYAVSMKNTGVAATFANLGGGDLVRGVNGPGSVPVFWVANNGDIFVRGQRVGAVGPAGPQGIQGLPGPATKSIAACGSSCGCRTRAITVLFSLSESLLGCSVTSETGPCQINTGSAGMCCVCAPN